MRMAADNRSVGWVPPGFALGFHAFGQWITVIHKVSDVYTPWRERTLLWNNHGVGMSWPLIDCPAAILSEIYAAGISLFEGETYE